MIERLTETVENLQCTIQWIDSLRGNNRSWPLGVYGVWLDQENNRLILEPDQAAAILLKDIYAWAQQPVMARVYSQSDGNTLAWIEGDLKYTDNAGWHIRGAINVVRND